MKTERVRRKEFKYNNNSNNIDFGGWRIEVSRKMFGWHFVN